MFEEHQLISFNPVNYEGVSHPPTPLAKSLDTLLQAAEGKQLWGDGKGGACTEVSGKGEAQQRCLPGAISFHGRCQAEGFIRLFKFLKTGW